MSNISYFISGIKKLFQEKKYLKPKCFLVEFAALIIIVLTAPFWLPIAGIVLGIGLAIAAVLAVLGIGVYIFK